MNLVFHTIFSVSSSTIGSKKVEENKKLYLSLGFVGNIITHGIMDILPHDYPLSKNSDALISLAIFLLSIAFVKKEYALCVFSCFFGGVLPDLIDKLILPIMGLRKFKLFPFHRANVINFFYKWYKYEIFKLFNVLAILVSLVILLLNIKFIINNMLKYNKAVKGGESL